jgi:hypothetical protein
MEGGPRRGGIARGAQPTKAPIRPGGRPLNLNQFPSGFPSFVPPPFIQPLRSRPRVPILLNFEERLTKSSAMLNF